MIVEVSEDELQIKQFTKNVSLRLRRFHLCIIDSSRPPLSRHVAWLLPLTLFALPRIIATSSFARARL